MKSGKCSKCGSDKVYSGTEIPLKSGPFGSNSIPISITSIASLNNYVCSECGYLESYVADEDKLIEIAKKWRNVNDPGDSEEA